MGIKDRVRLIGDDPVAAKHRVLCVLYWGVLGKHLHQAWSTWWMGHRDAISSVWWMGRNALWMVQAAWRAK